jgi:hypothetical protein
MSATNRGAERLPQDEYQTPIWVINKLFRNYSFGVKDVFLEPCVGKGNILLTVMAEMPTLHHYVGIDINNKFLDECEKRIPPSFSGRYKPRNDNFLFFDSEGWEINFHQIPPPDLIITNPPYKLMDNGEFLTIALKLLAENGECAFLLRLNWLGSQERQSLIQSLPFKKLLILSKCPSFTGKGADATEYAWMIFQKEFQGEPTFKVI